MRSSTIYAVFILTVFTLTRLLLCLWTGLDAVPINTWPAIFSKGLWFDLAVLSVAIAPVWLYEALLPEGWRASRMHRVLRAAGFGISAFILLFIAVAEATFWLEFSTRFNFIAVDYLLYTHEVIGNIRESYPIGWILIGIALVSLVLTSFMIPVFSRTDSVPTSRRRRIACAIASCSLPLGLLTAASIDQMGTIGNAYADELSGNGIFTFFAAERRNELDYDRFYATLDQDRADAILRRSGVERLPLNPNSMLPPTGEHESSELHNPLMPRQPRHIVMVTVESLSAKFLGCYGSAKGLTPNLDRLAREGMRFTNFYATGTRTVRGLEAVSLGTPPVPGQAIVRRPGNEHLTTIGELLRQQGFASSFLYGGYGYFDNMNAYFSANDYDVIDRTDIPKAEIAFENIWGVADESLFEHALGAIDAKVTAGKPTFTHIMTTTNHRPFTYPDGRVDIPSPGGRDGAIKYTDWAIGNFIEKARARPWFDDTLFVILADHCASVAGKSKLPVAGYRIPLILYAPRLVTPSVFEPVASQIDLPPTLLDILRVQGDDHFFGRSVFELPVASPRAFVSNYQQLGYLRDGTLIVLSPGKKIEAFRVDPSTDETTPISLDRPLAEEAIAYYQTAARAYKLGAMKAPDHAQTK